MAEDLMAQGHLKPGAYRNVRLHAIEADGWLNDLSLRSKFNTEWTFLNELKARGRAAADDWLKTCLPTVGFRASVDLQARFGMAYLFIAHDLAVVEHVSHRTAVMYLGALVEVAPTRDLFAAPRHPYTQALLASVPVPDPTVPRRPPIEGELPSAVDPPSGCRFHTRCPIADKDLCTREAPPLRQSADGHWVACHLRG
jgi:oligopeptide/dipeptide ABC transporter ATP-binding protein